MSQPQVLRPNPRVFVRRSVFRLGLFTIPAVLAATAAAPLVELDSSVAFGLSGGLWALLLLLRWGQRRVVLGKTRYRVHPDRIVYETGGLISERSVDLQFRNVTQVSMKLPFLEHRLFATGHLTVQAAGSVAAEVRLESVDEPAAIYQRLAEALRANGFSLARSRQVQIERPGVVGAIYVVLSALGSSAFALFIGLQWLIDLATTFAQNEELVGTWESILSGQELAPEVDVGALAAGAGLGTFLLLLAVGVFILKVLDILRRTYTLHDDVIDYADGFLTKHRSFIPMENLADVEINESLMQRLLSISTLKVSCQGAGSNISLAALPNGKVFKENLERLIDEADLEPATPEEEASEGVGEAAPPGGEVGPGPAEAEALPPVEHLPRVEGRYDWTRGLVGAVVGAVGIFGLSAGGGLLVWLLVPEAEWTAGVSALVFGAVAAASTMGPVAFKVLLQAYGLRYAVDQRKVTHTYEVVERKQLEFTVDKISAVEIRRTPIDRLFGTARVTFTSIGSATKIQFEHLKNADEVVDAVLTRMGLDPGELEETLRPRFSLAAQLRAADPPTVLAFLLGLSGVGAALFGLGIGPGLGLVTFAYALWAARALFLHFHSRHARLELGHRWLRVVQGLWGRVTFYAPERQIRGLSSRCNLGETRGYFAIHSGGGAIGQLGYLEAVPTLHDRLDARLHRATSGRELDTSVVDERRPVLGAALLRWWLPLLLFLPLLPYVVVAIRRIVFRLERERIRREAGVLFHQRYTILLERIDHLTTSRGLVHRLTGTGALGIRTLGSQGTDLAVSEIRDHQAFYERIEALTQRRVGA